MHKNLSKHVVALAVLAKPLIVHLFVIVTWVAQKIIMIEEV